VENGTPMWKRSLRKRAEGPYEWKENGKKKKTINEPKRLDEINQEDLQRLQTPDPELNRVLGGGIVPGSSRTYRWRTGHWEIYTHAASSFANDGA